MKQKFVMFFTPVIIFIFSTQSCNEQKSVESKTAIPINKINTDTRNIKVETFETENGWGYKILIDDKIFVNQPHIPAIEGMKSFKSNEDALKTAKLVAEKIKRSINPPTISINELDSLQVLN